MEPLLWTIRGVNNGGHPIEKNFRTTLETTLSDHPGRTVIQRPTVGNPLGGPTSEDHTRGFTHVGPPTVVLSQGHPLADPALGPPIGDPLFLNPHGGTRLVDHFGGTAVGDPP